MIAGWCVVNVLCDLSDDLPRQVGIQSSYKAGRNNRTGHDLKRRYWRLQSMRIVNLSIDFRAQKSLLAILSIGIVAGLNWLQCRRLICKRQLSKLLKIARRRTRAGPLWR